MLMTINPTGHYEKYVQGRLREECGIIPQFYYDAMRLGVSKEDSVEEVYAAMLDLYGYGLSTATYWGTVDEEGVLTPPDGDKMYPYVKLAHPDNEALCYVYAYGIVSVTDGTTTRVGRFD